MSDPDHQPTSGRPWWLWGGLLVLVAAVALAWASSGPTETGPDAPEPTVSEDLGGGQPEADVARVQGQVFVERIRPTPIPVVEVVLDSAGGTTAAWADSSPDGWGTTSSDEDSDPPPVDLEPPPEGRCQVLAWQNGEPVSELTPCVADGSFEVVLFPGHHGRTAFEILVPGHLRAVLEVDVPEGGVGRLPPVALGQAQRIEGHVVDAHGEPMPEVVVHARPQPDLDEPEPWRATSDADGSFAFATLPPGPVTLRVELPGYAPSVVEALAPQTELLITMQALVDLHGRVVGPPEALARASVRIEGSGIWPVREQAIEADGRFVIPQIPDGIYAVEAVVEAEQPGQPELASIPLENVTPELALTLALVPAFRVPVEVRDPSGDPVEGARVVLSNASIGLLPKIALTNAKGQVAMGPMVPGPYIIRAHADGFLPSAAVALTVQGPDASPQILTLGLPGRIEGQVVDEHGEAVADARVELQAEHLFTAGEGQVRARFARAALRSAGSLGVTTGPVPEVPHDTEATVAELGVSQRSDSEGRFVFEMLTPGRYGLQASHGRYARSEEQSLRLKAGQTRAGLELVLRTGHRLTGRVLDGNDRPVEGAWIRFADGRRAWTDGRGVFDGGIRQGPQRMVASADGLAPRRVETVVRDEPVDVEIVLGRARAKIDGRIEGGNGEALVDARVTLRLLDGLSPTRIEWTDEHGVYRFDDLPPGIVELEVDHPGHGPATRRVEIERDEAELRVDIALVEGWTIEVEVVAEGTGEPLEGVVVEGGGRRARTNASGQATLDHLLIERVRVEVHAKGFSARRLWIERDGSDLQARQIELSEGGSMSGRITDYRGDPVVGVDVIVRAPDATELGRTRTNTQGRWSLSGVPAGDVQISVDPPPSREDELAPATQSSDVLRGHETRGIDLRLDRH